MKRADHVPVPLSDARIERQWAAIDKLGLPGPVQAHGFRNRVLIAVSSLGLVASLAAFALLRGPAPLRPGALVESAHAEIAVQLEDGSRVALAPESRLRLLANEEQAVQLELSAGSAHFAVEKRAERSFAVQVGAARFVVIGTRFRIEREEKNGGLQVTLRVSEGVVEVQREDLEGGEPRRVHAGEAWTATLRAPQTPAPAPTTAIAPVAELEAEPEPDSLLEPESAPTSSSGSAGPSAADVFRRASLARRAGQMREAAEGYAKLLERFPRDPRAGLSAFELGRLRMDALSDPEGAIDALERALRSRSTTSFQEDALARIVMARDALAETELCKKARARYLRKYPSGVHAASLAQRCQ
jgi:TolA-binding protein